MRWQQRAVDNVICCKLVDGSPLVPSVTRRRHSSAVAQQPTTIAAAKTATRRKAASLDEADLPVPCKQPQVEISPLKDMPEASDALTEVCEFWFNVSLVHLMLGGYCHLWTPVVDVEWTRLWNCCLGVKNDIQPIWRMCHLSPKIAFRTIGETYDGAR